MQRAVAFRLFRGLQHFGLDLGLHLLVALLAPGADADEMIFSRSIGSPSGQAPHSSFGRYFVGSSEVEWAPAR